MTTTILSAKEKATKLNRLMKLKFTGTPCEGQTDILGLLEGYSKETNIIIDSMIWKAYGIHYKDYLDTALVSCGLCSWDPIKLEKAIDRRITYLEQELDFNITCRKCGNHEVPACVTYFNQNTEHTPLCFDCKEAAHDEFNDLMNSDAAFEEQWQDDFAEWVLELWLPE
jgi:hypothetical protein